MSGRHAPPVGTSWVGIVHLSRTAYRAHQLALACMQAPACAKVVRCWLQGLMASRRTVKLVESAFASYRLQDESLVQQARWYSNASIVIQAHGAALGADLSCIVWPCSKIPGC